MPATRVLIIDDEKLIRWSLGKNLNKCGYRTETAETGEDGLKVMDQFNPEAVILDNKLPGISGIEVLQEIRDKHPKTVVLFMTAFGTIELAVEAMKKGAYDYVNKPFVFDEVKQLLEKALYVQNLDSEVTRLKAVVQKQFDINNIIAESKSMKIILELVDKIARSEAPTVMLTGESGVGKDKIARLIHGRGQRNGKPFITINCASLSETLLESELFGHEKGAFTDAKSMKRGQLELAAGGTVYLDEIGEITLSTQVKLLQVIENRLFRRVGGVKEINIDSLMIAATNIDIDKAVEEGRFRRDLFYRLNLIPIEIPPLRKRRDDIIPIAKYFMNRFNEEFHKNFNKITDDAKRILYNYDWHGNTRELRNVIERIIILENDEIIESYHLPAEIVQFCSENKFDKSTDLTSINIEIPEGGLSMEAVERDLVEKALSVTNNNQTKASKLLDVTRDSLRYKMKKFGLL